MEKEIGLTFFIAFWFGFSIGDFLLKKPLLLVCRPKISTLGKSTERGQGTKTERP